MKALLELQYMPTLPWLFVFLKAEQVFIEQHENFVKSTFRNRCEVAGPNGKNILSVPVKGGKDHHQRYCKVQTANDFNWRKNHLQTLCSNYRRSPFFEYYEDKVSALFAQETVTLFDFNLAWLQFILQSFRIEKQFSFTDSYRKYPEETVDFRAAFVPGAAYLPEGYRPVSYTQPFSHRIGFIANLSAIDLLFCEGPKGLSLLSDQL